MGMSFTYNNNQDRLGRYLFSYLLDILQGYTVYDCICVTKNPGKLNQTQVYEHIVLTYRLVQLSEMLKKSSEDKTPNTQIIHQIIFCHCFLNQQALCCIIAAERQN